jgi:O-antigen/teichoic acid export membrane protein
MKSNINLILLNNVVRNSLFGMFYKLLWLGLGFVLSLLITNIMGVSASGLIAFATSIAVFIWLLISLGTDAYIVKLVAQFHASVRSAVTIGLLRSFLLYRTVFTALVFLLFYILYQSLVFTFDRFNSNELKSRFF